MRAIIIAGNKDIVVFQDIAEIISAAISFKGIRSFFRPDCSAHPCNKQGCKHSAESFPEMIVHITPRS